MLSRFPQRHSTYSTNTVPAGVAKRYGSIRMEFGIRNEGKVKLGKAMCSWGICPSKYQVLLHVEMI